MKNYKIHEYEQTLEHLRMIIECLVKNSTLTMSAAMKKQKDQAVTANDLSSQKIRSLLQKISINDLVASTIEEFAELLNSLKIDVTKYKAIYVTYTYTHRHTHIYIDIDRERR